MKKIMLSLLCFVSFAVKAQTGLQIWPPKIIDDDKQDIHKRCVSELSRLSNKPTIKLEEICRNTRQANDVRYQLPAVKDCFKQAKHIKTPDFDPLQCLDSMTRFDLKDKQYIACVNSLDIDELSSSAIKLCKDYRLKTIMSKPEFLSCYDSFRNELGPQAPLDAVDTCRRDTERNKALDVSYRSCHLELKKMGYSIFNRISFCGSIMNDLPAKIGKLKTCHHSLAPILEMNPSAICLNAYNIPDILTSETLNCIEKSKVNLSKNFFKNISNPLLTNYLKSIPTDCVINSPSLPSPLVSYHSSFYFSTGERFNNDELAGLSGLDYDHKTQTLFAISDQRFLTKNILFKFKLNILDNSSSIISEESIYLKPHVMNEKGTVKSFYDTDMEGIAIDSEGNFITSSESLFGTDKGFIKTFNKNGDQIDSIELAEKFYPNARKTVGQPAPYPSPDPSPRPAPYPNDDSGRRWIAWHRNDTYTQQAPTKYTGIEMNKGFEALALSIDGQTLFTANEAPLKQDYRLSKSIIRISSLEKNAGTYVPSKEYFYEMEQISDNGIVDITPLTHDELLVLERSYDSWKRKLTARIYKVSLKDAQDVQHIESIEEQKEESDAALLKKELIIDLDDIIGNLPPGLRFIDNLEGMTLGPKTPQGKSTLILVSDNNLSSAQVTQFIILEHSL